MKKNTEKLNTYKVNAIEEYASVIPLLLDQCQSRVCLLHGELGAGKTTFVKSVCAFLGVEDLVDSPTFSIVNQYDYIIAGEKKYVFHLDLYRIKSVEEALDLGIYEILDSKNWVFIEWPDVIIPILDGDECQIKIEEFGNNQRKLVLL